MTDETTAETPQNETTAETPQNIRVLYVGSGIHRVQPGDVFTRAHLTDLGANVDDLLALGSAELTDAPATVEPAAPESAVESAADMPDSAQ